MWASGWFPATVGAMTPTLHIERDGEEPRILPLKGSVSVGRSPDCTLVVEDPEVSGKHCVLWVEHGVPWIRDLDSRNGTYVGDKRVGRATPLVNDAVIRAGSFTARVQCTASLASTQRAFALRDEATGIKHVIRGDRYRIGPGEGDDLQLGIDVTHTVLVHEGGEVWLGDEELEVGQVVDLGAVQLKLVEVSADQASTIDAEDTLYSYEVAVDLNGHTGPEAEVTDPVRGLDHTVDATNRAILLYVLARQWAEDSGQEVPRAQRGWCIDDDLIIGVWGKAALADGGGKLKALLHRLRVELKEAGFDPWFIEKKRGYTRIRVAAVKV